MADREGGVSTRSCEHCGVTFTPKRPHGRFCSDVCRYEAWVAANENSRENGGQRVGGNPIAEVRAGQEAAKSHWSAIVREAIIEALRSKGTFHADDLHPLGIPAEHRNIIGSQIARLVNQGWMVECGRRKSATASRHQAKSNVYRLTRAGAAGVGGSGNLHPNGPAADPGDAGVGAGVSDPQESEGAPFLPSPWGASANSGDAAGVSAANRGDGEGSVEPEGTRESPVPAPYCADPGGSADRPESPALFDLPPEPPLNPLRDSEAA